MQISAAKVQNHTKKQSSVLQVSLIVTPALLLIEASLVSTGQRGEAPASVPDSGTFRVYTIKENLRSKYYMPGYIVIAATQWSKVAKPNLLQN